MKKVIQTQVQEEDLPTKRKKKKTIKIGMFKKLV